MEENKFYVVICNWADDYTSETNVCNRKIYKTLKEAKSAMKDIIEEDIQNNEFHRDIAHGITDQGLIEVDKDWTTYSVFRRNAYNDWHFDVWIVELTI